MEQRAVELKLLDHVYDIGKTLLLVFMRILALYATIMAVFFALLKSGLTDPQFMETLKQMCLILTGAMIFLLCVFHFFVQYSAEAYCKISEAFPENCFKERFPEIRRLIQHLGRGLFVMCATLMLLMLWMLLQIDVLS